MLSVDYKTIFLKNVYSQWNFPFNIIESEEFRYDKFFQRLRDIF